ncbi:hypothetical protein INS49_000477 [Diaporthe citri]|uniref:uncharacterized protein n=1 Tax=Diaporthe citri TaxID=83186 RepID=UPI001C7E39CA|nr:uncharacterized protein INS49_000477 [Diaporthe citri]KAG6366301.1 hypothetical protein INS49_000477 [Diaporthe citri]
MGIPGLTAALRPFASWEKLADSVVVDGPAFAYHIFFACRLESKACTALEDPSYSVLGSAAIWWLDNLQSRRSQVAAIYFDGYLPASKKDVRLGRVVEQSTAFNKYFLSTKSGIARDGDVRPSPRQAYPRIPVPAFTVPAILEALRTSERYGHLTHLVSGEADTFCADHVTREGGALLTSDSDLLLYDLGQHGSVVFLSDIEITAEQSEKPLVLTYSQHAICERLSLEPGQQAMLSLAFEMERDPYQKIAFWAAQSKKKHSASTYPAEYADFISEYVKGSHTRLTIPESLRSLDPRVSEFLLSWSEFLPTWGANVGVGSAAPQNVPKTVGSIFYLPLLLDRWDHESAWGPSTWIRQLAYSFCPSTSFGELMVAEYRRTMSRQSNGQAIELLRKHEMTETAHRLLSSCKAPTNTAAGPSALRWVMFCLRQEIVHASEQGKESLVKELLRRASKSKGKLDPGSWTTVHSTAQIQGTLYSLRILYQILQCLGGPLVTTSWPQLPVAKLMECLATLPSIEDYPSITDVAGMYGRLKDAGELKDITGLPDPVPSGGTGRASDRMKRRASKQEQRKARPLPSTNPFDALSPGS